MSNRTISSICIAICVLVFNTINVLGQVDRPVMYKGVQSEGEVLDLVRDSFIANQCFDVLNVSSRGRYDNRASIGSFSNGALPFGMESGIVLASTSLDQISGGNSSTGAGGAPGAIDVGTSGDVDLNIILQNAGIGVGSQDVSSIEFDFIPTSNRVSFEYVFASEEYCDFVDAGFNDIFGMFLSGPGIAGGQGFLNDAINIATFQNPLTGDDIDVTIDNVNNSLNNQLPPGADPLFIDNNTICTAGMSPATCPPFGPNVNQGECAIVTPENNEFTTLSQFDGWTALFTADFDGLIECQTYHIKIAVSDVGDNLFGSAVFLRQSSFTASDAADASAQPSEAYWEETMDSYVYESCGNQNGVLKFPRLDLGLAANLTSYDIPITFQGGTANYGADYISDLSRFDIVNVPFPGACHSLEVLPDDFTEPIETISIEVDNPCGCESEILELQIIDVPPLELQPLLSDTSCFGISNRTLEAFVTGGFPEANQNAANAGLIGNNEITDFTYLWTNENGDIIGDEMSTEVDVSQPGSYTFFLEVSDDCGNMIFDTVNFVTSGIPDAELEGEFSICAESPSTILGLTLSGTPPWTLQYDLNGIPQPPLEIDDPDFVFEVEESGMYEITRIDGPNCGQDVEGLAIVNDQSFDLSVDTTPTLCSDSEDGMLMAVVANGTGTFDYLWSDATGQTTEMATGLAPGTYTVTVTDELGCTQELMGEVMSAPEVSVTPSLVSGTTCGMPSSGSVSAIASGGTENFDYEWFDNAGLSVGIGSTIDDLTAGDYEVLAIDENGCEIRESINIPSDENTPTAMALPAVIDCNNPTVTINTDGTSIDPNGVEFTYEWTVNAGGGSITSGGNSPNAVVDAPGMYTLTVINTTNGCSAEEPVLVTDNRINPMADAGLDFECIDGEVMLGGPDLATGANITYEWTATNGGIIPGASDVANPMVSEAGTYQVLVTNLENGCTNMAEVNVSVAPEIATEMPLPIDCRADGTVTLSGLGSETGADITYEWVASNGGVIVSGNSSINPVVSQGGTYSLVVSNSTTGCSSPTMEVVVDDIRTDVVADPGQAAQINCNVQTLSLGGANTSIGGTIEYEWQINPTTGAPSTANTATITATQGGTYSLLVTDTSNGCTAMNEVVISEDTALPDVMIADPDLLTCEDIDQVLSSNGSSTGDFTYTWSTVGGNIISSVNDQNVEINDPGMYTLTIMNNVTGCVDSTSVEVFTNAVLPEAIIADPLVIDCRSDQVLLDGSASASGMGIEYTWRDETGAEIGTASSVMVGAAGQYTLEVFNTLTGCPGQDAVMVMDIREDPTPDVGDIQGLNCDVSSVVLGGDNLSTGAEFEYEWSLMGAGVISTEANPEILQGGDYTLVVTNNINGCTAMETITIDENTVDPDIDAEPSGVITCEEPTQTLMTDGSSAGPDFEYTWTGPNGFMSNEQNPEVTIFGTYTLTITNIINRCSVTMEVDVDEDADFPDINIQTPEVVNCRNTIIELSGEGSAIGNDIVYSWVASNGGVIEDDEDTLNPEISAAGTYTLTVNNTASGCSRTEEIVVTDDFVDPIAMVNPNLTFGCQDDILDITGLGSSTGNNFEYTWTASPGNISGSATDIDTQIDQPGEYMLLVTNTENGCTAMASLMVTPDEALPDVTIAPVEMITCGRPMITIDATGSALGTDLIYDWDKDGVAFTPTDNFVFTVEEPGLYTLTIEDTANGCISEQTITVMENTELPTAEAGDGIILNCRDMMLNLDAGDSSAGGDFAYSWTATQGGVIVSGDDTDEPLVSEPGLYALTVTNTLTGCTSTDDVSVLRNDFEPVIEIIMPAQLNCRDELITLDAMDSDQGGIFEFEWTEMGTANIESGEQTLTPTVDAPGIYILTITNTDNFCVSMQEVEVTQNIMMPEAEILDPAMLNCDVLELELDGTQSSQGDNFTYSWSIVSGDGSFAGSTDQINTTVDGPGIYELLVTNTDNFCEETTTIQVFQNIDMPIVMVGENQVVTCDETLAQLSGAGSSVGSEFEYIWTPANGGGAIVAGGTTLTPTVDSPGEYQLTVRNTINGCTSTMSQFVTSNDVFPQEAPPTPLVLNCEIVTQTLTSQDNPGLSYEWTTEAGTVLSTEASVEIDAPGIYIMNITDNVNGCSTPNQFEVIQDITPPMVDAGPTSELTCTETIVALLGEGSEGSNFTYEWTTVDGAFSGSTDQLEAFATAGGAYTLTIFNEENRCSASSTVDITVDENTPSGIEAEAISPMCFGDLGGIFFENIIGGVGPFMYSIDGGLSFSDDELFSSLEPGVTYDLLIEDDNGCTVSQQLTIPTVDSLSVTVAEPMVEIELGETLNINATTNFPEEEIVSITWTPSEGLSCTDCLTPQATPGFSGSYEVMVVSENGCVDNATLQFRVDRSIDIYIPNAFSPHNVDGINDLFMPLGKPSLSATVQSFQIYDRWGEQVFFDGDFELNDPARGWNGVFRETEAPNGVYVYYIVLEFVDGSTELYEGDVTLMN